MSIQYYAYHGPKNDSDFNFEGGYGFSQKFKQRKPEIGDRVFIIQKRPQNEFFELCGLFEVCDYYEDEKSQRPYRVQLKDYSTLTQRIQIDENELSDRLPELSCNPEWTNFKRHFCRQGASFQSQLTPEVIEILHDLLRGGIKKSDNEVPQLSEIESRFALEVVKAQSDSKQQRLKRLAAAPKQPQVICVMTKTFLRNPDVVAEVLDNAKGICDGCHSPAPFNRRTDGSPYLEVHHRVHLADGGEDTVSNAMALCPNCHRKMHLG